MIDLFLQSTKFVSGCAFSEYAVKWHYGNHCWIWRCVEFYFASHFDKLFSCCNSPIIIIITREIFLWVNSTNKTSNNFLFFLFHRHAGIPKFREYRPDTHKGCNRYSGYHPDTREGHNNIYIYIYVRVCVCVCVCDRTYIYRYIDEC